MTTGDPSRGRRRLRRAVVFAPLALAAGLAGALVAGWLGGGPAGTPRELVARLDTAVAAHDGATLYDLLTIESQLWLDDALKAAAARLPDDEATRDAYGGAPAELSARSGRELLALFAAAGQRQDRLPFVDGDEPARVELAGEPTIAADGRTAHATLRLTGGDEVRVRFVNDGRGWYLDATTFCGAPAGLLPQSATTGTMLVTALLALAVVRRLGRGRVGPEATVPIVL